MSSCAFFQSFQNPHSAYQDYIERHLVERKHYDRTQLLLSVKALAVTQELVGEQNQIASTLSEQYDSAKDQVILAVNFPADADFAPKSLEFWLGGVKIKSSQVKEVYDQGLVKGLYSFADPYFRTFHLKASDGARQGVVPLEIRSSVGVIRVNLTF